MMFANKKSNDEDLLVLRSTGIVAIAEILCDFLMSRKQKLHCPFSSSRLLYDLLRKWDALCMDMGHGTWDMDMYMDMDMDMGMGMDMDVCMHTSHVR